MTDRLTETPDGPGEGEGTGAGLGLEELAARSRGTLLERMGIRLLEVGPDLVSATMPVEGNTQPYGLLHGGASCVLAETLGSVAAAAHAAPLGLAAVGLDINATHHRAVRSGVVTGVARAISRGRTVAAYAVEIEDEAGRRVCTARLTCLLVPASSVAP